MSYEQKEEKQEQEHQCKDFQVNWKTLRLSCISCKKIAEHLKIVFRYHSSIPGRMLPRVLNTKEL